MASQEGTILKATVIRVVDGDTLVVDVDGSEEKLRLAALDTEESNRGSDKPVTPWGKKAKEEATAFFPVGTAVTLEFAGTERPEEAASSTGTTSGACWCGPTEMTKTSRST